MAIVGYTASPYERNQSSQGIRRDPEETKPARPTIEMVTRHVPRADVVRA